MPDEDNQDIKSLEQLQKDLDTVTNNWKRALADFENYKRRKEAENKELVEFAREVTVAKLLPTIDALEQALRHMPEFRQQVASSKNQVDANLDAIDDFGKKYENWQTGINAIIQQLDKALAELGVSKIEALGKKFDPNFHEAVKEVGSDKDEGIIIDEFQSGFILNNKVIRPSQVVVSKKSSVV